MKSEAIFRTVLFLLSPLFAWFVNKVVIRRVEAWHAARTLEVAKRNLRYYLRRLDDPPSLFEQVAVIVCFLPIPIASIFMLRFLQNPPNWMPHLKLLEPYPQDVFQAFQVFRSMVDLTNYVLFGVLGVSGVEAAYRLRHGEGKYIENYRAEVRKKIAKLLKKFPELEKDTTTPEPDLLRTRQRSGQRVERP